MACYGSTSCCIRQWPNQWQWSNFDPHNSGLTDDEIRTLELPPEDHPPCKISFRYDDVVGLGEYPVCQVLSCFFLSLFGLFVTCTSRTGGPILTIYTSYDSFPPKAVPFGGFVDIPPHLGVMNRHFQA